VARANVLKGIGAGQVLRSRHHRYALIRVRVAAPEVLWVEIVKDRMAGHDVHAPDCVDHVDEAREADPDVIVDMDAKVVLDSGDRGARAAIRVGPVDLAYTPC